MLGHVRHGLACTAVALLCAGCDESSSRESVLGSGDADAEELVAANQFAERYLRAAVRGEVARLCAMRTEGALRRWGGLAACKSRAVGLALDPPPLDRSSPGLRRSIARKSRRIDPASAEIVRGDTGGGEGRIGVVIDFGKAFIESGHAVGGQIIEMELRARGESYRVSNVGIAVFAD